MLQSNQIFIHIPKTGGTTLNCAMHNQEIPIDANFNFRHIVYETKCSNSGDIFNPLNYEKYQDYKIFMMLRHPVDRIISEYYFLKERDEFISLIKPYPKSFEEYISNKQTGNYMCSFLLGYPIFSSKLVDESDLQLIKNTINELDITVGIYEKFEASLSLFESKVGIHFPNKIHNKRVTIKRPSSLEISEELKSLIIKYNSLDMKLYEFALNNFENYKIEKNKTISFQGDKYDYVLVYANRFPLIVLELNEPNYLRMNEAFLKQLNENLLAKKYKSGKEFVHSYNVAFLNALKFHFPQLLLIQINGEDPLNDLKNLGEFIFKNIKTLKNTAMVFKPSFIENTSIVDKFFKMIFK